MKGNKCKGCYLLKDGFLRGEMMAMTLRVLLLQVDSMTSPKTRTDRFRAANISYPCPNICTCIYPSSLPQRKYLIWCNMMVESMCFFITGLNYSLIADRFVTRNEEGRSCVKTFQLGPLWWLCPSWHLRQHGVGNCYLNTSTDWSQVSNQVSWP